MKSHSVVDDPAPVTQPTGNYHTGPGTPLQGHCKDQASIALLEYLPLSPLFALHFPQGLKKKKPTFELVLVYKD